MYRRGGFLFSQFCVIAYHENLLIGVIVANCSHFFWGDVLIKIHQDCDVLHPSFVSLS